MAIHIGRREFIVTLGGAAAWPLGARAQQSVMPVIGFINGASPDGYAPMVSRSIKGLNETGFAEGRNVLLEYRWTRGHHDRLPGIGP